MSSEALDDISDAGSDVDFIEEDLECDSDSGFMDNCVDDYKKLSSDDIMKQMNAIAEDLSEVIDFSPTVCRLLLREFKWDREALLQKYYDCAEPSYFLSTLIPMDLLTVPNLDQQFIGECEICCDEGPLSGLKCGHVACSVCWNQYINSKVKDDGSFDVKCIDGSCEIHMNDEQVLFYIMDEDTRLVYQRLLGNAFVDSHKLMKWCPGAGCGRAMTFPSLAAQSVYCDCGGSFCSSCNLEPHMPLPCHLIKVWGEKHKDGENVQWLLANSRPCPVCKSPIEKNGGCNYMQCRQPHCQAFFCWQCMQHFNQNHQPHNCHVYTGDGNGSLAIRDLERFKHYKERFIIHEGSLALEKALTSKIKVIKGRHELYGGSDIHIRFLDKALSILLKARAVLMYVNPVAYFLSDTTNREILEANQKDLEVATEKLSFIFEQEILPVNIRAIPDMLDKVRVRVQDKMSYVDSRRRTLLIHCAECVDDGLLNEN